jgi:hypothetical protein
VGLVLATLQENEIPYLCAAESPSEFQSSICVAKNVFSFAIMWQFARLEILGHFLACRGFGSTFWRQKVEEKRYTRFCIIKVAKIIPI